MAHLLLALAKKIILLRIYFSRAVEQCWVQRIERKIYFPYTFCPTNA